MIAFLCACLFTPTCPVLTLLRLLSMLIFAPLRKHTDGHLVQAVSSLMQSECDSFRADAVAHGRYVDAKHTPSYTGQLHLSTSGAYSDHDQMFAAGYLEGYMSASEHCPPDDQSAHAGPCDACASSVLAP